MEHPVRGILVSETLIRNEAGNFHICMSSLQVEFCCKWNTFFGKDAVPLLETTLYMYSCFLTGCSISSIMSIHDADRLSACVGNNILIR